MFENAPRPTLHFIVNALNWVVLLDEFEMLEKHMLLAAVEHDRNLVKSLNKVGAPAHEIITSLLKPGVLKEKAGLRFSDEAKQCLVDSQQTRSKMNQSTLLPTHIVITLLNSPQKEQHLKLLRVPADLSDDLVTTYSKLAGEGEGTLPLVEKQFLHICSNLYKRDPKSVSVLLKMLDIPPESLEQ